MEGDSNPGLGGSGAHAPGVSGALSSTGTAVPHVCPLVGSLGGRAQTGFFLPESSVPGTEEIIVCVAERPNIFQNVPRFLPCPLSLSLSQALQQPRTGRGTRHRELGLSLPCVQFQLGLELRGRNRLVTLSVL